MTYQQTVDYLYSCLPMFTKLGLSAYKSDLNNINSLCHALGNPQHQFKSIHVGGTNGKGSSSHQLAAILQKAGYKTGLYTSPHLKDFRERIRINGKMISKAFVRKFVKDHQELFNTISPSFFEATVAMAFLYFATQEVDVAVVEVGLGGRLDSTNIIHPQLALITNISKDHTNILGDTLEEIAAEKAGIIKTKTPVVISERQAQTAAVFMSKAQQMDAPIVFADDVFHLNNIRRDADYLHFDVYKSNELRYANMSLDLNGSYQLKNIRGVLESVDQLRAQGYLLPDVVVMRALKQVKKITGLQGRWYKLQEKPLVIADTGHNEAGIKEVLQNIAATSYNKLHLVIGMVKDKDIEKVLSLLPVDAEYYFCKAQIDRALDADILAKQARKYQLKGKVYSSVAQAIAQAKQQAQADDLIFIGGSTFVVAEAL